MGEKGMLSLGNPPSSGLEVYDERGLTLSPPDYSFPQRFRKVCRPAVEGSLFEPLFAKAGATLRGIWWRSDDFVHFFA